MALPDLAAETASYVAPSQREPAAADWSERVASAERQLQARPWLEAVRTESGTAPFFLNALIQETSPYLLQHAFNPIDWVSWRAADGSDQRLRFISIGYSTCHWCHEMAKQSFADPIIAAAMNPSFVAIKVDREELPEVDARYTRLQRLATGSVGWPVTIIETAEGQPVYVGAFVERHRLLGLLKRLAGLARSQPAALQAMSASYQQLIKAQPSLDSTSPHMAAVELPATQSVLDRDWDAEHGGLRGEQKFPNGPALEWLLDRAVRGEAGAASALRTQLRNMLTGGLYDPLHGGFYRYATQPDWSHPHFEKMLYTQAQLIGIYARASRLLKDEALLRVAEDTARFVDDWFGSSSGVLRQSAIDAQYQHREGGYYLLPQADVKQLVAKHPGLIDYPVEDAHALRLAPGSLRSAAAWKSTLSGLRSALPGDRARPFIDDKQLTGWNAMLGRSLLQLALVREQAMPSAQQIADALLQRFDSRSGRLQRDQFGRIEASLEDYVQLALLLLDLYDHGAGSTYLAQARALLASTNQRYLPPEPTDSAAWSATDEELPAAQPLLCEALSRLVQRSAEDEHRVTDERCRQRLSQRLGGELAGGNWTAMQVWTHQTSGRATRVHYFAEGRGRVEVIGGVAADTPFELEVSLQPGWHINASKVLQPNLTPTRLGFTDESVASIDYPEAEVLNLGFNDTPLALYQGQVRIRVQLSITPCPALLQVQACSDSICLLPEKIPLFFW